MKAMCEEEIIPADYPPFGYNCHGGYEFSNGTGNIHNQILDHSLSALDRSQIPRLLVTKLNGEYNLSFEPLRMPK